MEGFAQKCNNPLRFQERKKKIKILTCQHTTYINWYIHYVIQDVYKCPTYSSLQPARICLQHVPRIVISCSHFPCLFFPHYDNGTGHMILVGTSQEGL